MPEALVVKQQHSAVADGGGVIRLAINANADRAFCCEYMYIFSDRDSPQVVRIFDAHRTSTATTRISGFLVDNAPPAPGGRPTRQFGYVSVDGGSEELLRDDAYYRSLVKLRADWEVRYASAHRKPLDYSHRDFASWISQSKGTGAVLLLGEGDGRNIAAVPPYRAVCAIDLSPAAASLAVGRGRPAGAADLRVEVGDLYRWLQGCREKFGSIAALYLGPATDGEWALLLEHFVACREAGGSFFMEAARFAVPLKKQLEAERELGILARVFRRPGEDLERVQFCTR